MNKKFSFARLLIFFLFLFFVLAAIPAELSLFQTAQAQADPPPPPPKCDSANFTELAGICVPTGTGLPGAGRSFSLILTDVLKWILYILGFLALLAFVVSGLRYVFSQGDKEEVEKAKETIKWSIIGVAIALSSLVILNLITKLIGG